LGVGGRFGRRFCIGWTGGRFAANARNVRGINDGDGLGMLVLLMMLLCVNFLMFLQILGTLKRLFANLVGIM